MMSILTKIFFDPNQGNNPSRGYTLEQDFYGNGTASFTEAFYASGGYTGSYIGSTPVNTSEWIHIALVIDGKDWRFYHNNVLINNQTSSSFDILDDGSKGNLTIGSYGGGFLFDGNIDDVIIYNRALSTQEIQQIYEQTVTKY